MSSDQKIQVGNLRVSQCLHNFINNQALPGTGIEPGNFWQCFSAIIDDLAPRNRALLEKREDFQSQIDDWHVSNRKVGFDATQYRNFLTSIGYLIPEGRKFSIGTEDVDPEIATIAGPQLVVPIMNARYALNAANARWGSLYDALYGTDAIDDQDGAEAGSSYNPIRGAKVVSWAKEFLDKAVPLAAGNWKDVTGLSAKDGSLVLSLSGDQSTSLSDPVKFCGFNGTAENPKNILLVNNGLHLDITINPDHPVGKDDCAHIADIVIESALTSIMDCEDSVAAVDADDKVLAYGNWLGLMKGDLSEEIIKGGRKLLRSLNPPRIYQANSSGASLSLNSQALMLIRNVGHLMSNPAILDSDGREVPEGIMDAMITTVIAMHDVGQGVGTTTGRRVNSQAGSVYVVKPKMHGPEEVAFAGEIFDRVEAALGLAANTVKLGIMDEERRTTINLKECIRAVKNRVAFINTGFLDRTGDEIHTSMEAGAMIRKGDMKQAPWISAYEDWNVDIGLECGLSGKAQIGKGMWAMPDLMADMLEQKIAHLQAGANTAWVPSPTGATLHATHYHQVNVAERQRQLVTRKRASLDDILTIPVISRPNWNDEDIQAELDNNAQGILGYVVRWIDHGVGCSKVPDINNIGLMEDRATLRISAQHMANWLHHGVISEDRVVKTMRKMAKVVDGQNADDPTYQPMSDNFDTSIAFNAALDLVLLGRQQPSGYTEPLLHERRLALKAAAQNQQ